MDPARRIQARASFSRSATSKPGSGPAGYTSYSASKFDRPEETSSSENVIGDHGVWNEPRLAMSRFCDRHLTRNDIDSRGSGQICPPLCCRQLTCPNQDPNSRAVFRHLALWPCEGSVSQLEVSCLRPLYRSICFVTCSATFTPPTMLVRPRVVLWQV